MTMGIHVICGGGVSIFKNKSLFRLKKATLDGPIKMALSFVVAEW